ncbi:MAG TPA: RodZ domain-containing protein, partial [Thermoanaerobaculia bacterium]
ESPELGFGEELRRERQIRGISLEEISSATKISVRLLSALERGDVKQLPAPAFTRGFIRAYSTHLGIDADEKVNAYLSDLSGEPHDVVQSKRPRSRFWRGRRGNAGLMVAFVGGVLLVLGFIANPQRREREHPAAKIVPPRAIPVAFKNVAISNEPTPLVKADRTAVATSGASASVAPISLKLEFDEDSWAKIVADGTTVLDGIVRRGETRSLEARAGFRVTLGNAGGVRVSVDGRALDRLGAAGEVVRDLPLPAASTRG